MKSGNSPGPSLREGRIKFSPKKILTKGWPGWGLPIFVYIFGSISIFLEWQYVTALSARSARYHIRTQSHLMTTLLPQRISHLGFQNYLKMKSKRCTMQWNSNVFVVKVL